MDFGLTWEGVAALLALAVSLYNLREARRAPAKARQRELRDDLRVLLEDVATEINSFREDIREGNELNGPSRLRGSAKELRKLAPRIRGGESRLKHIATKLDHTADCRLRVVSTPQEIQWRKDAEDMGVSMSEEATLDDLDDACQDVAVEVLKELDRLRVLESR